MTNVELVDGGVYWVRPSGTKVVDGKRVDVIMDEPVLAQYRCQDIGDDEENDWFNYFGTDFFDSPEEVIVVAGPLDIPSPKTHTDWAKFAREQVAEAEARGWRKDANLGWVLDVPEPEKEAEK